MNHLSKNAIFSSEVLDTNLETIIMINGRMFPLLFIIDLACVKSINVLEKANEKAYYGPPHKWLLIDCIGTYSATELDKLNKRHVKRQTNASFPQNKITISGFNMSSHKSEYNLHLQRNIILHSEDNYFGKVNDGTARIKNVIKDDMRKPLIKLQNTYGYNSINRSKRGYNQLTVHYKHLNTGKKIIVPFEESFEEMNIFIDSQIFIITMQNNSVLAIEIYRRGKKEKLTSAVVAQWSKIEGFTWKTNVTSSVKRMNLHKTEIKAAMVVTDPNTLNHLTDLYNRHIDTITKVNYGLFMHAIETLNASVEFFIVDSWGYSKNGSWNGMVGYLQRQEADVGATALFFTSDRTAVLDYIAMTTPTRAAFYFRQPPLSLVSNLFTLPFSHTVWLASAGLVVLSCGFLFMTNRWEKKASVTVYGTTAILNDSWSDVAILAVGAICQQGSTTVSHGIPGRIVTFLLFVTVMFLYTSYSANIVALLQSSTSSIQTLEDLLKSPLKVGVHDIVYNRHYFQVANDPIRRALYHEKVSPPGKPSQFMTLEEGVRRVQKGLFAFHSELNSGWQIVQQTFQEEEKCGLQTIPFLQVIDPYLAVQKNSPYKETFKIIYRRLWECGLQGRHVKRLYTRKPLCNGGQRSSFVSVGIADCYPAILVLLYGVLFSVIIAVVECMTHRWK